MSENIHGLHLTLYLVGRDCKYYHFLKLNYSFLVDRHDIAYIQDNEPLMRALSKLVYVNSPDLVLFVGEALVGNDAVDQLSKFNQVR